jgi:hypothetical protein
MTDGLVTCLILATFLNVFNKDRVPVSVESGRVRCGVYLTFRGPGWYRVRDGTGVREHRVPSATEIVFTMYNVLSKRVLRERERVH